MEWLENIVSRCSYYSIALRPPPYTSLAYPLLGNYIPPTPTYIYRTPLAQPHRGLSASNSLPTILPHRQRAVHNITSAMGHAQRKNTSALSVCLFGLGFTVGC